MTKKQIKDHLEAMEAYRDGALADYISSLKAKVDSVTATSDVDAGGETPTVPLPPLPPK